MADLDLSVFKGKLIKQGGEAAELNPDVDYIGLYFSAHWCPPCRGFTPELAKYYEEMKGSGKKWEVIFCSSDRDAESFNEYFGTMPWLALKFDEGSTKQDLSNQFGVRGIPTLIILDNKGKTVTADGRAKVMGNMGSGQMKWSD